MAYFPATAPMPLRAKSRSSSLALRVPLLTRLFAPHTTALADAQEPAPPVSAARRRLATMTQTSSDRPTAVSTYQMGTGPCV